MVPKKLVVKIADKLARYKTSSQPCSDIGISKPLTKESSFRGQHPRTVMRLELVPQTYKRDSNDQ